MCSFFGNSANNSNLIFCEKSFLPFYLSNIQNTQLVGRWRTDAVDSKRTSDDRCKLNHTCPSAFCVLCSNLSWVGRCFAASIWAHKNSDPREEFRICPRALVNFCFPTQPPWNTTTILSLTALVINMTTGTFPPVFAYLIQDLMRLVHPRWSHFTNTRCYCTGHSWA